MSSENIATIIQWLPTLLTLIIVVLCMLRGLLRGFRKSTILLVHYVLALVAGFVIFFVLKEKIYDMDLNFIFKLFGEGYADVHTIYEFATIGLTQTLPEYAPIVENEFFKSYVLADIGLAVNLALGIVCLIIVPIILRFIFYIFYLLLYSEGKHKKHVLAEGDDYHKHRFLGMIPQAIRGVICATLSVALINSVYFLAAGGDFYDSETTEKDIEILDVLNDTVKFDVNDAYNALKNSRKTGVGPIYEAIKINGVPIDYYYIDLFSSVSFESYRITEDNVTETVALLLSEDPQTKDEKLMVTLSLRTEIAKVATGLVERILETNCVNYVDGQIVVDPDILDKNLEEIFETCDDSILLSDTVPAVMIALVDEVSKGNISISPEIDEYLTTDVAEALKHLDFGKDVVQIAKILVTALELVPINEETGQIDFEKLQDINYLLNLDKDVVSRVFSEISEVSLLSDICFPIASGILFNQFEDQIKEFGIDTTAIDLNSIDWKKEIAGLGGIYSKVVDLELDLNRLLSTEVDEETGETLQMIYLKELAASTKFKDGFLALTDEIMESDLLSQAAFLFIKSAISKLEIVDENGNPNALSDALDLVKENLNKVDENGESLYGIPQLQADIHTIVNSCLDVLPLISLFTTETIDPMQIIKDLDTDALRGALIGETYGETGVVTGGIYNIRLASGDFDGNGTLLETEGVNATDSLVSSLLKIYGVDSGLVTEEGINSITDWPEELNALINTIEDVQEMPEILEIDFNGDILANFPTTITYNHVDDLTEAVSGSKLLSDLITNLISQTLEDPELEDTITIPDDIIWMDSFDEDGNISTRGEVNKLLKVFILINKEDNKIDLNDPDSILNGFANFEEEDVNIITDSTIIVGSLDNLVGSLLTEDGELSVDVTWENTYDSLGSLIKKGELNVICDILKLPIIKNPETNKIDFTRLSDINELASLIKYDEENEKDDYSDVVTIAESTLIMSIISDKISDLSSDSINIVVPDRLLTDVNENAWKNWAYDTDGKYENGEFGRLVNVLYNAKKHVLTIKNDANQNKYSKLDTSNLIEGIIGMPNHECVTDSLILYATISNEIVKLDMDETIKVRSVAKESNPELNDDIVIKKNEINSVLKTINQLEMTDFSGIDIEVVLNKLSAEDDTLRKNICASNILNITTVYNLIKYSNNQIDFDGYDKYNIMTKDYNPIWYPVNEETWSNCELNNVLLSVAELGVKVDKVTGEINIDPKELLYKLNDKADSSEPLSGVSALQRDSLLKIDVVYRSHVMKNTVTMHVENYRDNTKRILIRDAAYDTTETDIIACDEILLLVNFLEGNGLNINEDISTQKIVEIIGDDDERKNISNSNILNITIVDKIIESDPSGENIKFGPSYSDVNYVEWYPGNGITTTDSEIYRILCSINELGLDFDIDGNVTINPKELLYKLNDDVAPDDSTKKLVVVYRSYVMRHTVTMHVENYEKTATNDDGVILIRDVAYDTTETDVLAGSELLTLVNFLEDNGLDVDTGISTQRVLEIIDDNEQRKNICDSNILNITVVDKLVSSNPSEESIKFGPEYKNVESDSWYPGNGVITTDSELYKVLTSVNVLEISADKDGNIEVVPEELLYKLNDDIAPTDPTKKIDVVYRSYVMRHTVTMHVENYRDNTKKIKMRNAAYDTTETDVIARGEILTLVNFLEDNGLSIDNGITTQQVLEIIDDSEQRENICDSNILNITVVDKLVLGDPSEESIKFGPEYKNVESDSWYPGNGVITTDSELYKVLTSVNALEISADKDGNIEVNSEELLYKLNDDITPTDPTKKIDVVYRSYIMRHTITMHVLNYEKTSTNPSGVVLIRDNAYDTSETDIVASGEILSLVNFLEDNGLSIDSGISTQQVLGIIDDSEQRENICNSNILNITVVDKIVLSDPSEENIKFGPEYKEVESDSWYPGSGVTATNSELYKMLTSIVELDIQVDGDNFKFDPTDILYKMNDTSNINSGVKKADTVFESIVMAQTITNKVESSKTKGISIRDDAFDSNNNIKSSEVIALVDFLEGEDGTSDDISIDSNITAENILDRITLVEVDDVVVNREKVLENIDLIVSSNILNITIVKKLSDAQGLYYPQAYIDNSDNVKTDYDKWYGNDGELSRFLKSFAELNDGVAINISGNDININQNLIIDSLIDSARTSNNSDDKRIDVVYESHVFEKTIGKHVLEAIDVPNKDSEGNSIIVELVIDGESDKVVAKEEVKNLITSFKAIEVNFGDDLHGDHDPLAEMTLERISNKLDDILSSAILHHIISDRLIKQDCIDSNSTVEGIVPLRYYAKNDESQPSIKVVYGYDDNEKVYLANSLGELTDVRAYYIVKDEVEKAIAGLVNIYPTDKKISDGFILNSSMLFGRSEEDITLISNSALLSYMFSHLLISEGITQFGVAYKYYQYLGLITHSDMNYYEPFIKDVTLIEYESENYKVDIDDIFSLEEVYILLTDLQTVTF